jgi:hypothetical protein
MRVISKRVQTPSIYQLKITLEGVRPPIWRRVLVPAGIRLDALHTVIQAVMDWTDSHMHEFVKGGNRWTLPNADEDAYSEKLDERKFRLHELLSRVGESLLYVYDFGDDWRHKVVLEKILPQDGKPQRPFCVGGKRTAPPEDCGGIHGFVNMEPDEEYEEGLEFSVAGVDAALAHQVWPAGSMG